MTINVKTNGSLLPLENEEVGIVFNSHFLIADPHPLFAQALCSLLRTCGAQNVRCVDDYADIVSLARIQPETILIFNINTPESKGILGLDRILRDLKAKSVIVVLDREDIALENFCRERGVAGIISMLQTPEQIRNVVTSVMLGEVHDISRISPLNDDDNDRAELYRQISTLSPKESLVFTHLREGCLNKQIAHELELSEATIKYHVGNILRKLNCHSRTQAAVMANRHGF